MPIALPGLDRVPEGPRRDLVVKLHDLYGRAGRPATRIISNRIASDPTLEPVSHETVSSTLRGDSMPAWAKVRSIIVVLCRMIDEPIDIRAELVQCNAMWVRIESDPQARQALPVHHPSRPPGIGPLSGYAARHLVINRRPLALLADSVVPQVHGELPGRAPFFTGRELLLDEIERRQGEQPDSPLVLYGPIGAGKTQLVAEYVRQHQHRYAVVWWVTADDLGGAQDSLVELARRLGVEGTDRRQTLDQLFVRLSGIRRYLLVFDGVRSGDIRTLVRTINGNVIVTTRNTGWARESTHAELEVPDFDPGEAAQFLRKRDPHMTGLQMSRLIDLVGRSPAALTEVCRLYEERSTAWEDLADRLTTPANALLTTGREADPPLVGEVRDALGRLDPASTQVLTLLLGFGPSPVWVPMLQAGATGEVTPELRRSLGDQFGLRRRTLPGIVGSGLARSDESGERIEIPAVIRLVLRELLPESYAEENRRDVLEILVAADPGHPEDGQTREKHRAIAPHVRPAGLVDWARAPAYRTIRHQIRYLFLSGQLAAAQRLGREAEAALTRQAALPPNDELVLQIRRDLANALRAEGRYTDSDRVTEDAMSRLTGDGLYGTHHAIALDLARSRGHDLRIAGDYQAAYDLDQQTYQRHVDTYPEDDFRTIASRYNLAVSLRFLGRFAEAEATDAADLDRLRRRLAAGDRRVLRSANALAEDLYGLGRYEELLELLAPVLKGGSGRSLLRARRMTGIALRRLGQLGSAAEQLGACYQACLTQLGEARELTLAVCTSLGNALREVGQFDTALHYGRRAASLYAQAMGPDNPLVHAARVNIATIYLAMDRGDQALETVWPAHLALRERLGDRHPFTIMGTVSLASARAVVDPASARPISGQAWEDVRDVLGDDHLDALIAAAGFAADRAARNEDDGPWPSLDEVLGKLRRRLGAGHPLVVRTARGTRPLVDVEPPSA